MSAIKHDQEKAPLAWIPASALRRDPVFAGLVGFLDWLDNGNPERLASSIVWLRQHQDDAARVLEFGAQKYAAHNWRQGFKWSRVVSAVLRHWRAMETEHLDPESGLPHVAHALVNMMFLLEFQEKGLGENDLHWAPKPGDKE